MARFGDVENGEASRKRLGVPDKSERAKKKARPIENISKLSRKRAWTELAKIEALNADQDSSKRDSTSHSPSRKVLRVSSQKKPLVREADPPRKWKRAPKAAIGGLDSNSGAVGSSLRGASAEQDESGIDLEEESVRIVSGLEQTALNGRDRKRREADTGEGSPPRRSEKMSRIDVAGAEASHRSGEQQTGVTPTDSNTWKRLKRLKKGKCGAAATAELQVSISEAWKRVRDWKDTETSGSSVNGGSDNDDVSMHSCSSVPELVKDRSKKARHESPLPSAGRKWKRRNREKKQRNSGKRQRDSAGCECSGNSGSSDIAQTSYLHNRQWKRPRHEDLMSVQGRSLRRPSRDSGEAPKSSRKRLQCDASGKSNKWPRK